VVEMLIGALIGFAGSAVLWFFDPTHLRQRLGFAPKPEAEPIIVQDVQLSSLRRNPLLKDEEFPDDALRWELEVLVPTREAEGMRVFRTRSGARIIYLPNAAFNERRSVLLWVKGHAPK
jgi:hypothetical protein